MLTFRDSGKEYKLKGFLKMITNKNYKIDLASLADKNFCMILQKNCISM